MQSRSSVTQRPRTSVLAEPSEVIVTTLRAHPDQWFRIAGADYCRDVIAHQDGCQCNVRVLTQTAYRIRERTLGAFVDLTEGCLQVVATSARSRPDRRYDVEIKARFSLTDC